MEDYEVERKISELERKVNDLDYELRRAIDELHDKIVRKADRNHEHGEG